MTFEQRKFLVLSAWTATALTAGIIMTVEDPSMWLVVVCVALVPPAVGNWLWIAPEPTLSEIVARHRR